MFFYIALDQIKVRRASDRKLDPFNRSIEAFQTWQLSELEELDGAHTESKWARQGFSVRSAPDGGVSLRKGQLIKVFDPMITFALTKNMAESPGATRVRFDMHYWESDSSKATKRVRAIFNDDTLAYMKKAWESARADEDVAREALTKWFEDNWEGLAGGLLKYVSPAAAGIVAQLDLLPALGALAKFAVTNGDDYHQMHRFVMECKGGDGNFEWRVVGPSTVSDWKTGAGALKLTEEVRDGSGSNVYDVTISFRLVD